jgi:hypothetical protein
MGFVANILLLASLMFRPPAEYPDLALRCRPIADAKAEPLWMPRASAFLVSDDDGFRLEDRFDVFDLWRFESIRARWRDSGANRFSICRIERKFPVDGNTAVATRSDYLKRYEGTDIGAKDLAALDEAVCILSPVDIEGRVKPRRSQRQNLAGLWRYSTTNENAHVYAFRPRTGRKERADWYLVSLESDDPEAAEKIDAWLDEVEALKGCSTAEKAAPPTETELLARDYRRSTANYADWHFASASNVVVVDDMADCFRGQLIDALTNGLPRMQAAYAKILPSPLYDDSHVAAVRIFASREEYLAYVGPEMKWSAALWSPLHRELVLYCPETGSDALLRTVWHEALHQHLDYACSMIQSPAWFNEGHAVLFEHSHFDMDGAIVFDPVPAAVAAVKADLASMAEFLPYLFAMDYQEFYSGSDEERMLKYHLAWSVAYFIEIGAPEVRFKPFENLRRDLMKFLVSTRDRKEASKKVLTAQMQEDLVAEWLSFWKKH